MCFIDDIGITHILNVTDNVECYYPKKYKYAQIKLCDVSNAKLLPYWKAAVG